MQARLKCSTKWTPFPKEYVDQMKLVLDENLKSYINRGEFLVEGRIYREEIMLRVGFLEKGRLRQTNFEASLGYSFDKDNALETINTCFDCCSSLMAEYLDKLSLIDEPLKNSAKDHDEVLEISLEDQMDLPYTWTQIEFEEKKIFVQFSTINSSLEAQADLLLGDFAQDDSLVLGADSDMELSESSPEDVNENEDDFEDPDNLSINKRDGRDLRH